MPTEDALGTTWEPVLGLVVLVVLNAAVLAVFLVAFRAVFPGAWAAVGNRFRQRIAFHRATKLLRSRFPEDAGEYSLHEWDRAFRDLGLPKPDSIDFLQRIRPGEQSDDGHRP